MGAFTPVGVDVPQTMGSLLSRLQWFDDLDLIGALGEPIAGARVRLRAGDDRLERYVGMSRFALGECQRAAIAAAGPRAPRPAPAPLLLATSRPGDLPCAPALLLERVLEEDGGDVDRAASAVFADGRAGALHALGAASELLHAGRASACYVGGVDSLLDPVRLHRLLAEGRLLDGAGSDGFVPGEAAVFLRLETRAAHPDAVVLGTAVVEDRAALPASGSALARAAAEALRQAELGPAQLGAVVHDGAIEPVVAEEIAMAATRLPRDGAAPPAANPDRLRPWAPAYSVGETGAASAWLALAMTAFFLREGVFAGPVLTWLTSDGAARGAVVMGPAPGRDVGRDVNRKESSRG